jgi:hypothetical protein
MSNGPGRPTMIDAIAVPWPKAFRSRSIWPLPFAPKSWPDRMRPRSAASLAFTPLSISAMVTPCPRAPWRHNVSMCQRSNQYSGALGGPGAALAAGAPRKAANAAASMISHFTGRPR